MATEKKAMATDPATAIENRKNSNRLWRGSIVDRMVMKGYHRARAFYRIPFLHREADGDLFQSASAVSRAGEMRGRRRFVRKRNGDGTDLLG